MKVIVTVLFMYLWLLWSISAIIKFMPRDDWWFFPSVMTLELVVCGCIIAIGTKWDGLW